MVVVTGDVVEVERAVEFVAHSVHSVLVVATTFGFEGWDLYVLYMENVVMLGTCLREYWASYLANPLLLVIPSWGISVALTSLLNK
jgi:hypothetical protein